MIVVGVLNFKLKQTLVTCRMVKIILKWPMLGTTSFCLAQEPGRALKPKKNIFPMTLSTLQMRPVMRLRFRPRISLAGVRDQICSDFTHILNNTQVQNNFILTKMFNTGDAVLYCQIVKKKLLEIQVMLNLLWIKNPTIENRNVATCGLIQNNLIQLQTALGGSNQIE